MQRPIRGTSCRINKKSNENLHVELYIWYDKSNEMCNFLEQY